MSVKKIDEATPQQKMRDLLLRMLNACFGKAGLAEGTNAATIKTVAAVDYCIDGLIYTKAITDNIAITAAAVQAISTFCKYLVSVDAAGTVTVTKGTEAATSALALVPALPASSAPIGYFEIATDGVTTYTAGTTDNGAAGITDTYQDMSSVVTNS
jgi:hypothetical protein